MLNKSEILLGSVQIDELRKEVMSYDAVIKPI